jgi:hypothetical protein
VAVLAAVAFARCSWLFARAVFPGLRVRLFGPASAAVFFLIVYHNFTSDSPHPDNLYLAHAGVTLWLTLEAVRRPSAGRAAAAVLFGGLGVFAKQVAALSAAGASAALAVTGRRGTRATVALLAAGAAATIVPVAALWSSRWAKFYTYDVLSTHGLERQKLSELLGYFGYDGRRLLLLVLAVAAVAATLGGRARDATRMTVAYLVLGALEVGPTLSAFLKPMGAWNNLAIVEVWMAVPALPWLFRGFQPDRGPAGEGPLTGDRFARSVTVALGVALLLLHVPVKAAPHWAHRVYCGKLQGRVERDLAEGKKVLVAHGATFLIRAHQRQVPLDRSNSCLELRVAGLSGLAGTARRVEARAYDTIYLNTDFYPPEIVAAIERNYREVERIPGILPPHDASGFQRALWYDTRVMERLPGPGSDPGRVASAPGEVRGARPASAPPIRR